MALQSDKPTGVAPCYLPETSGKNNTLTNLNHGFRSGFLCETQLLVTLNDFFNNYDAGLQTDIVILDFSKAFDTLPHHELLCKLESFGIEGSIYT